MGRCPQLCGDLSGQAELEQANLLVEELGDKATEQIAENLSSEAANIIIENDGE